MSYPCYTEYKHSGLEWLGELPAHWSITRLKYIASHNDDVLPETTDPDYVMQYVDISSVTLANGIEKKEEYTFEKAPSRARRRVKDGDTIVSTVRTYLKAIAPIEVPEDNLVVSTGFAVIRPRSGITPRYLAYQLQTQGFVDAVVANSVGVSYPAINASELVTLPAMIPSEDEQRAIAAFLDHETSLIDTLIAKKQRLLELLSEKRTALISHSVTKGLNRNAPMKDSGVEWLGEIPAHWEVLKIKRIAHVRRGASPRPIDDPKYFDDEGEYSWVRIGDVTASERYLESTTQRLSELGQNLSVKLMPGELFLSIAGSVGKPIITKIKCCIHDGFVYFHRLKQNPEFLYYLFASEQPYLGLGKLGTQLNLNTDTVGDIRIGLPSREEQQAVVAFLDRETSNIDVLTANVETAINKLREFRSTLIADAVTGKIDVRNVAKKREVA